MDQQFERRVDLFKIEIYIHINYETNGDQRFNEEKMFLKSF